MEEETYYPTIEEEILQTLLIMVDGTRADVPRWFAIRHINYSFCVYTKSDFMNTKSLGRALKRIFPSAEKRKMASGFEILISPKMIQEKITVKKALK
jgi:hypothetical protein